MHLLRVAAVRLLATQSTLSQLGGVRAFNDEASSRRLHLAANFVQPNYALKAQEESSIRLVIFDKDGVLVDFSHMWLPWAENTVSLINEMTSKDHTEDVFRALGVCPLTKKVKPGPLAEKTLPLIRQDIADMLRSISYTHPQAEEIAHSCVREANYSHAERTRSIVDLRPVFETLNSMGIYTAVCTADFRKAVECQLQLLGIDEYPSMVMCGDDTGAKPKPDPHCALKICEKLGVQPHEAIVVGDTIVDMRMGRAAGLRASVAVLSGIGCPATLSPWADHYINDVSEVVALIKQKWMKTETNKNMDDYQLCF